MTGCMLPHSSLSVCYGIYVCVCVWWCTTSYVHRQVFFLILREIMLTQQVTIMLVVESGVLCVQNRQHFDREVRVPCVHRL